MEAVNGEGDTSRTHWQRPDAPLGTLIFREGLLSAEQLEDALGEAVKRGKRLGQVLVERGLLEEAQVARILAKQKGLPFVDLRETSADPEAAALLPGAIAWLNHAVPVSVEDGTLLVAVDDPGDEDALNAVADALGRTPRFAVATRSEILRVLGQLFNDHSPNGAASEPEPVPEPELELTPLRVAPPPEPDPEAQPAAEPEPVLPPASATAPDPVLSPAPAAEAAPASPAAPGPEALPVQEPAAAVAPAAAPEVPSLPEPLPAPEAPAPQVPAPALPPEPPPAVQVVPVVTPAPEEPVPSQPVFEPGPPPEPVAAAVEPPPTVQPLEVVPDPVPVEAPRAERELLPEPEPVAPPFAPEPVAVPEFLAEDPATLRVADEPVPAAAPVAEAPLPPPPASVTEPEPVGPAFEAPSARPAAEPAGGSRVVVRLSDGDEIEAGSFASRDEAKAAAKLLTREIAVAEPGEWPELGGRFIRPELIVSVDVS